MKAFFTAKDAEGRGGHAEKPILTALSVSLCLCGNPFLFHVYAHPRGGQGGVVWKGSQQLLHVNAQVLVPAVRGKRLAGFPETVPGIQTHQAGHHFGGQQR